MKKLFIAFFSVGLFAQEVSEKLKQAFQAEYGENEHWKEVEPQIDEIIKNLPAKDTVLKNPAFMKNIEEISSILSPDDAFYTFTMMASIIQNIYVDGKETALQDIAEEAHQETTKIIERDYVKNHMTKFVDAIKDIKETINEINNNLQQGNIDSALKDIEILDKRSQSLDSFKENSLLSDAQKTAIQSIVNEFQGKITSLTNDFATRTQIANNQKELLNQMKNIKSDLENSLFTRIIEKVKQWAGLSSLYTDFETYQKAHSENEKQRSEIESRYSDITNDLEQYNSLDTLTDHVQQTAENIQSAGVYEGQVHIDGADTASGKQGQSASGENREDYAVRDVARG